MQYRNKVGQRLESYLTCYCVRPHGSLLASFPSSIHMGPGNEVRSLLQEEGQGAGM